MKKTKEDQEQQSIELGLPNLDRFKRQLTRQFERQSAHKNSLEKKAKLQRLKEKLQGQRKIFDNSQLMEDISKGNQYEIAVETQEKFNPLIKERKTYMRELKKLIEQSDIILEVLDARDPLACRCKDLEAQIQGYGDKKIILVLNKIDLIPSHNAEAWLKYLRREYATVLFKSNTQSQNQNLQGNTLFKKSLNDMHSDIAKQLLQSSKAVGADNLLQLIKNYSKQDGVKHSVTVGLVGYPNVGKSSVINSLKKAKSVSVSSVAGHTKCLQEVVLDQKVKLIDCPGVVFSNDDERHMVLRNIIKIEDILDPISPIQDIIQKANKQQLLELYKLDDFNDVNMFIANLAVSRGCIHKVLYYENLQGGSADLEKAARIVIQDWNSGKIKYFTATPDSDKMVLEID